jgi:nitrous oxidase accessory protein
MRTLCAAALALLPAMAAAGPASPSDLQARIAAARPGERIEVGAGTYRGDLLVDRPVHLVGTGRPLLLGSGDGTVVTITAAGVVFEGFDVDGRKGGDLGKDASGILIAAPRVTVRDCRIANTLFGVYLKEAPGALVEGCRIRGIKEKAAGEKGSGIHVWNTDGFTLTDNEIFEVRDGIYIQSSPHGTIRGNVARDLRYGLHYMYSDDNLFEDNVFENGDAGTAIMYSRRLTFRRNQFLRNRGFASVGLLLNTCDEVVAEQNIIADNARGIFIEGSTGVQVRDNAILGSDVAVVLFASSQRVTVSHNTFAGNLAPLLLVGRRPDAAFTGNFWSENDGFDLDGDGRTDTPYPLTSVFDEVRSNLTAADLFSRSLAASALGVAERALPVLAPAQVVDPSPLAAPPDLHLPPLWRPAARRGSWGGIGTSTCALLLGAAVAWRGRRP